MHLTKKIKINPTEEQVDVLWQLSEQCRCLYNFALAERKDAWKTEQRSVKVCRTTESASSTKSKIP